MYKKTEISQNIYRLKVKVVALNISGAQHVIHI